MTDRDDIVEILREVRLRGVQREPLDSTEDLARWVRLLEVALSVEQRQRVLIEARLDELDAAIWRFLRERKASTFTGIR
jgi:hypothetical protein